MRTTKEMREKLERAAAKSGRSLVGEVEYRLERSFDREEVVKIVQAGALKFDPKAALIFREAIRTWLKEVEK
jgi:hypothetical protein